MLQPSDGKRGLQGDDLSRRRLIHSVTMT